MATLADTVNDIRNSVQSTTNRVNSTIGLAQANIGSAVNMVNSVKNKIGDTSLFSTAPSDLGISNAVTKLEQATTLDDQLAQNPTYELIGKPTNITPIQQISGGFSVMADPVSMAAAAMGDKADSFLKPNYSLLGDLPGVSLPKNPLDGLLTKGKDGLAKLTDFANAPKAAIEGAKADLLKGSESLKASFNTLPSFMQKAILNESGVFDRGMMSARTVTNNVGNFYNKAMSGDYVLNPKSMQRDINALTSFTSAAIKGGVANTIVNLIGGLGSNFGPIGSIVTKVGAGMLISKNSKGLSRLGVSLYGNRNALPMNAMKPSIVKAIFSGLKKEPNTKANDRGNLRTTAKMSSSIFDKSSSVSNRIPNASAMIKPSADIRESFGYALKDRSIAPAGLTREQLASDAASRGRMMDMLNATDAGMERAMDSTVVLSSGPRLSAAELQYLSDNTSII